MTAANNNALPAVPPTMPLQRRVSLVEGAVYLGCAAAAIAGTVALLSGVLGGVQPSRAGAESVALEAAVRVAQLVQPGHGATGKAAGAKTWWPWQSW